MACHQHSLCIEEFLFNNNIFCFSSSPQGVKEWNKLDSSITAQLTVPKFVEVGQHYTDDKCDKSMCFCASDVAIGIPAHCRYF